jgi:peptide deformylase
MCKIVQLGEHDALRQKAKEIPVSEINTPKVQKILADMKDALDGEPDGAALAAPQIGLPLRIFILSEKVFGPESKHEAAGKNIPLVYINPVIIKRSAKKAVVDEGCLSVRGKYGNIERSKNAIVEAYDEKGNKFTRGAGGLLAQAFQHECDHLDGVLFVDNAVETWDVDVPKKSK